MLNNKHKVKCITPEIEFFPGEDGEDGFNEENC